MTARRFHLIALLVWTLLSIPTVVLWRDSIGWISFMSAYAIITGHWASYQASRAEESGD